MRHVINSPIHTLHSRTKEDWDNSQPMRTHLIFRALLHVNNRYQLCRLASKATRRLHKPNNRLQDTTNDVLTRLNHQARHMSRSPSQERPG